MGACTKHTPETMQSRFAKIIEQEVGRAARKACDKAAGRIMDHFQRQLMKVLKERARKARG